MATTEHSYIRLDNYDGMLANISQTSEKLGHSIEDAFNASSLNKEKHEEITNARQLVTEVLHDLALLDGFMLREKFEAMFKVRKAAPAKVVTYGEQKKFVKHRTAEDKDFTERSQKALHNLQKNLEILKGQI